MINFVYNIQPLRSNHGRDKRCELWRIKNNTPELVKVSIDSFVGDEQLAIQTAIEAGQISKKNIEKMKIASGSVSFSSWRWEDAGIAKFTKIG